MGSILVVTWSVIGLFLLGIFLVAFVDVFKRKWRRKKIHQIAKILGWDFRPNSKTISNLHLLKSVGTHCINILEGFIEDVPVILSDVPVRTGIEMNGGRGHISSYPPQTILSLEFQEEVIPRFKLRPRMWADGFVKPVILGNRFAVIGDNEQCLQTLFNNTAIAHYEQKAHLYIYGEGTHIKVQYRPDNYLPATKEKYQDLINEGEYIVNLVKEYHRQGVVLAQ